MPYISKADQERSQWMTLSELVVELRESDKCDDKSAQDQIRAMLVDGV